LWTLRGGKRGRPAHACGSECPGPLSLQAPNPCAGKRVVTARFPLHLGLAGLPHENDLRRIGRDIPQGRSLLARTNNSVSGSFASAHCETVRGLQLALGKVSVSEKAKLCGLEMCLRRTTGVEPITAVRCSPSHRQHMTHSVPNPTAVDRQQPTKSRHSSTGWIELLPLPEPLA